jgi:hypothetical protein
MRSDSVRGLVRIELGPMADLRQLPVRSDFFLLFCPVAVGAGGGMELFGKLELQLMLNQFFDRAVYYGILGYDEATDRDIANRDASPLRRR